MISQHNPGVAPIAWAVTLAVKEEQGLAEKYAKAAHEIGRLEERVQAQAQAIQEKDDRILELEREVWK